MVGLGGLKMIEEPHPKAIVRLMTQAGLIVEEEERMVENYLWKTHEKGVN